MKKNVKSSARAKNIGKRTVRTKTTRAGAKAGFDLNIPAALGKKLAAVAESDAKFKGKNPSRYAMFVLKNTVSTPVET